MIDRVEREWGLELSGFGRPFGLGLDGGGRLHVTDMDRHVVYRFDAGFAVDAVLRSSAWNGPHAIAFAHDGRAFVTCYYTPGIYIVGDAALAFDVRLTGPATATLDSRHRLLVAEYAQSAVFAFDLDGRLAARFQGTFDRPHMARALPDGTVLVADTWHSRLQRFDPDGRLIDARVGEVPCPVAVDADADRGWLVTAWGDNSVVRFDSDGRPAGRLRVGGLQSDASEALAGLDKPYDARWLSRGRVAVADSHHGRVLIVDDPVFQ